MVSCIAWLKDLAQQLTEKVGSKYLWAHEEFGRLIAIKVVCSWQDVSGAALLRLYSP